MSVVDVSQEGLGNGRKTHLDVVDVVAVDVVYKLPDWSRN